MVDVNYSIIIPHKNIPDMLQRCIDSIPLRDDVQIIVVDDDSSPEKVDFEHFPGKNNSQVELYFTKEGKGAGYARNVGLSHAKGKWLLFADADDYFTDALNILLDNYINSDADIVYLFNDTYDQISGEKKEIDMPVRDLYKRCNSNIGEYDALRYECYAPWTKMVKRALIISHSIKFDEVKASNDVFFSVKVGHYADTIEVCPYVVYRRIIRQGSLQYSLKREQLMDRIKVGYSINSFLYDKNKIEHYNRIRVYIAQLRKISAILFIQQIIVFLFKSQPYILKDTFCSIFKKLNKSRV